jgi:hypothetical protein
MGIHNMTSATKFSLGAAALAMAGAAVVTPAVAQAADVSCLPGQTIECVAASATALNALAFGGTSTNPLIQNDAIWIQADGINEAFATDPDTVQVWTFKPLTVVPFLADGPIGTWFKSINNQSCFLGITTTLGGPYAEPGQYVHSYNRKGCNVGWTT